MGGQTHGVLGVVHAVEMGLAGNWCATIEAGHEGVLVEQPFTFVQILSSLEGSSCTLDCCRSAMEAVSPECMQQKRLKMHALTS